MEYILSYKVLFEYLHANAILDPPPKKKEMAKLAENPPKYGLSMIFRLEEG